VYAKVSLTKLKLRLELSIDLTQLDHSITDLLFYKKKCSFHIIDNSLVASNH